MTTKTEIAKKNGKGTKADVQKANGTTSPSITDSKERRNKVAEATAKAEEAKSKTVIPEKEVKPEAEKIEPPKPELSLEQKIAKVEKILGLTNLYTEAGFDEVHHIENALKAQVIFEIDRDYVVRDGEVLIVDEFTGRLMPGRRYSDGLHQALEAKEKVDIQR